jgi:hypothetical protein
MLKLVRFGVLALLMVGMGCLTKDDCQRAGAKLRPLVEDRARQRGEIAPGAHMSEIEKDRELERVVEQCRTKRKLHPDDPMVTMKCVLAADDEASVRACVASANDEP